MEGYIILLKKKLEERKGSSLIMVIFLLALISVSGIMVVNQIGNQLKFTTNRYDDMQRSIYLKQVSKGQ